MCVCVCVQLVGMIPEPGQDKVTPQESEIVDAKWMPLAEVSVCVFA